MLLVEGRLVLVLHLVATPSHLGWLVVSTVLVLKHKLSRLDFNWVSKIRVISANNISKSLFKLENNL